MKTNRRYWSWHLSALFYSKTYEQLAHQLDKDLFTYLGKRIQGAVVADCGCGPGVVTEKLLKHKAARIFTIDVNKAMLHQLQLRLKKFVDAKQVIPIHQELSTRIFSQLLESSPNSHGFDIILFKRSLYVKREKALLILKAAVSSLNPGGVLSVIHGERLWYRYAFGPKLKPMPHTAYHLFNRFVSKLGEKLGIGDYTLYTQKELLDLLREAAPGRKVELIPSPQQAYNLAAILA